MEQRVIKAALLSRDAFFRIRDHIKIREMSDYGRILLEHIGEYYEKDHSATQVEADVLLARVRKKLPKKQKHFEHYISNLPEDISVNNLVADIVDLKKDIVGMRLASALIDSRAKGTVEALVQEYLSIAPPTDEEKRVYHNTPIEDLVDKVTGDNLIPIYPTTLNTKLGGGIPRQSQILIYARPDRGKSTFAMNIAGGGARNGYRVLYFGNEDAASIMNLRFLSRITNMSQDEIKEDPDEVMWRAEDNGYDNFYFVDLHPGTIAEIRKEIEDVRPDIVIVDQIRLVKVHKDSPTKNLEEGCIAMRNLAKEFYFVSVLVTQAGNSATNKLYIDMEDVEWSNTGVQGQQDLMIGIGQTNDLKLRNQIMLSFPKNKLTAPIKPFVCHIDYVKQLVKGLKK